MSTELLTKIELTPIGTIRSGFTALSDCPSASRFNNGTCDIIINPELEEGLHNITLSSHIVVLYWFHKANRQRVTRRIVPGQKKRGVFASRSPFRPNPVALSVVKLIKHEGNKLVVSGLDCLDGTKVVDIKPYSPEDDCFPEASIGWTFP